MIVITNVEFKHFPESAGDVVEIFKNNEMPLIAYNNMNPLSKLSCETEIVKGEQFFNYATGERRIIGMTKKAQKTLKLPMDAFRCMSNKICEYQNIIKRHEETIKQLNYKITDLELPGFWKREWTIFKEYMAGKPEHFKGIL